MIARLKALIAGLGQNPLFVAANAHCWFAFAVVHTFGYWSMPVATALAAYKEFWFDARNETAPVQTTFDNVTDFFGYAAGIVAGGLALLVKW